MDTAVTKAVSITFLAVQDNGRTLLTLNGFFAECKWNEDNLASENCCRESKRSSFGNCKCQLRFVDGDGTVYR